MKTFYLGTPRPDWLSRVSFPLFISFLRIQFRKKIHPATAPFILDSGGFTILNKYGKYPFSPEYYAESVKRIAHQSKNLISAAIQDWMCEPFVIERTGKDVDTHQRLTIESFIRLHKLAPEIQWMPVIQGYKITDYWRHISMYKAWGIDLATFPLVGVGSICRRQATQEAEVIIKTIYDEGIKIHGFGLKLQGLKKLTDYIESADSMSWSFQARKEKFLLENCRLNGKHINCANCIYWASEWRDRLLQFLSER